MNNMCGGDKRTMDGQCSVCVPSDVDGEAENFIDTDNDQSQKCLNYARFCRIFKLMFFVGWFCIACYAFSRGNPAQLLHPTNSEGETCGLGHQVGKPNLLYLDLTLCAGLQAAMSACPSHTVCVGKCPNTYWTSAQGKSSGLEQFCDDFSDGSALSQLVEERSCPAYILPSKSVMGRCIPMLEDIKKEESKTNVMTTPDGNTLNVNWLEEGVEYVMDSLDNRGQDEKLLDYCGIILLILILFSLISISILSFMWYIWLKTSPGNTNHTAVAVFNFKSIKVAIKEASKAINKTILLIIILQCSAQVLVIFCSLTISSFLSTTGAPEYRVVDACSSETCINMDTWMSFAQKDICEQSTFAECTGCPKSQCVYHKFGQDRFRYLLHVYNLGGMVWMLYCVHNFGLLMMAKLGDLSVVEICSSFKKICRNHIASGFLNFKNYHWSGLGKTALQEDRFRGA